jgi:predicted DNA-binding transcriptional regulator AlpA
MNEEQERVIRKPELIARIGLSDATIWRHEKAGRARVCNHLV